MRTNAIEIRYFTVCFDFFSFRLREFSDQLIKARGLEARGLSSRGTKINHDVRFTVYLSSLPAFSGSLFFNREKGRNARKEDLGCGLELRVHF